MLNKLVSLVWENEPKQEVKTKPNIEVTQKTEEIVTTSTIESKETNSTQVNEIIKNLDSLSTELPLVNLYFKTLEKVSSKQTLDEKTKLETIMLSLEISVPDFNKEKLVTEFNKYIELIKKEQSIFDNDTNSFIEKNIVSQENEIKQYKDEITKLENLILEKQNLIKNSQEKLNISKNSFESAIKVKNQQIETIIKQIQ